MDQNCVLQANKILTELLESSSSSDEDEEIFTALSGRNVKVRVKNFVQNVIYFYSDCDVS